MARSHNISNRLTLERLEDRCTPSGGAWCGPSGYGPVTHYSAASPAGAAQAGPSDTNRVQGFEDVPVIQGPADQFEITGGWACSRTADDRAGAGPGTDFIGNITDPNYTSGHPPATFSGPGYTGEVGGGTDNDGASTAGQAWDVPYHLYYL